MNELRRRTVWYLHGFDPAPPARYRRIFEEAAGWRVTVRDLPDGEGWRAERDGTVTDFRHLRYDDLVRAFRRGTPRQTAGRRFANLFRLACDGTLPRLGWLAPRALGLALAPFLVVLAGLFGAALLARVHWLAGLAGLVVLLPVMVDRVWRHMFLDIVADLFVFMRLLAADRLPGAADLPARCRAFAGTVAAAPPADETLIVGHSLGGVTAILTLAETLDHWPAGRAIGLLTLGSTHGIVLVQRGPGRERLAAAIRRIATDERVFWVDVSSPRDAFCVPLTDPLRFADPPADAVSPRVISTRLARAARIPGDRRTVFTAMRRHMGYLLTAARGSGFDYAETVTGALTLRQRFAGRGNSPKARMWRK